MIIWKLEKYLIIVFLTLIKINCYKQIKTNKI